MGGRFRRAVARGRHLALPAEAVERLAMSAYLIGRDGESEELLSRAHHEFLDRGDPAGAARCAVWITFALFSRGDRARAAGWSARAPADRRSHVESAVHGYLVVLSALKAVSEGGAQTAAERFAQASTIGERYGDRDLIHLARQGRGRALIRQGDITAGVALPDEVMVAVTEGELSPIITGTIYCSAEPGNWKLGVGSWELGVDMMRRSRCKTVARLTNFVIRTTSNHGFGESNHVALFLLRSSSTATGVLMSESDPQRVAGWRRFPRHSATRLPSLRANILAGPDVRVINVARGGMLIESEVRLIPGSGVCLNVTLGDQVYQVAGRVSRVDASLAEGRVKYRAGVALDQEMAIFDLPPGSNLSAAESAADMALDAELEESLHAPPQAELPASEQLQQELADARREAQEQRDACEALRQAMETGETTRKQLIESQAAERTRWSDDRKVLQERARENEEQAAALARKIRSVVEAQRDQAEQHALEKARLEAEASEARQQLTELRAVHASLVATVSQRLESFDRDRGQWQAEQLRASTELAAAEGWCSDQQDLLYRIRQQMAAVFSLLEGSRHLMESRPVLELPASPPRELPAATTPPHDAEADAPAA
jgi:hypothetical protein